MSHTTRITMEIVVVQPGVSKAAISEPQLRLLSVTENYLTRISDLAMVLYRQDQSPRLDFWGSDVRSHTT